MKVAYLKMIEILEYLDPAQSDLVDLLVIRSRSGADFISNSVTLDKQLVYATKYDQSRVVHSIPYEEIESVTVHLNEAACKKAKVGMVVPDVLKHLKRGGD